MLFATALALVFSLYNSAVHSMDTSISPRPFAKTTANPMKLSDSEWVLIRLSQAGSPWQIPPSAPNQITMKFSLDLLEASGSTGCNTYAAKIVIDTSGYIKFASIVATQKGCEPLAMELESRFIETIENRTFLITSTEREMELVDQLRDIRMTFMRITKPRR